MAVGALSLEGRPRRFSAGAATGSVVLLRVARRPVAPVGGGVADDFLAIVDTASDHGRQKMMRLLWLTRHLMEGKEAKG